MSCSTRKSKTEWRKATKYAWLRGKYQPVKSWYDPSTKYATLAHTGN